MTKHLSVEHVPNLHLKKNHPIEREMTPFIRYGSKLNSKIPSLHSLQPEGIQESLESPDYGLLSPRGCITMDEIGHREGAQQMLREAAIHLESKCYSEVANFRDPKIDFSWIGE